jgi:hypothetical protein
MSCPDCKVELQWCPMLGYYECPKCGMGYDNEAGDKPLTLKSYGVLK